MFTLHSIANLQGIGITLDFGFKILKRLDQIGTFSIRIHVLLQPVDRPCLIVLFVLFEKSSSLTPTPLRWRSINHPRFLFIFFFLSCALNGIRKENRGSVDRLALHLLKNDKTNLVSKNKVTNPEKYVTLLHDSSLCTDPLYAGYMIDD